MPGERPRLPLPRGARLRRRVRGRGQPRRNRTTPQREPAIRVRKTTRPARAAAGGARALRHTKTDSAPPTRARVPSPKGPLYRHRGGIFRKSLRSQPLTLTTLAALIPPELDIDVAL